MASILKYPYPQTLEINPHRDQITSALTSAIQSVSGESGIEEQLSLDGNQLRVGQDSFYLNPAGKLYILAIGKAAPAMFRGAMKNLNAILAQGLVITKQPTDLSFSNVEIKYGDHPVPGFNSINASKSVAQFLQNIQPQDTLLCLISGGASALLTYPRPPLNLEHLILTTRALLACGATIQEINCIRKHLEILKGGGLLKFVNASQVISLIISDVIDDQVSNIASGPTAPDPTTFEDAINIVEKYNLANQIPASVLTFLSHGISGEYPETAKPSDPVFKRVANRIIASNYQACETLRNSLQSFGFNCLHLTSFLQGESRQVGRVFASFAKELKLRRPGESGNPPLCWIAGGETTVTLTGDGAGGRNQELALGAVQDLDGLPNVLLITLATDGEDGNSPAAGAVVSGETFQRAIALGMKPIDYIKNNDSFTFFSNLKDSIYTHPTHTNVNDLLLLCVY